MKNIFYKILILFLLIFSLNKINASEINEDYLKYEKLTKKEKEEIDLVPNEYVVYEEENKNVFRNRSTNMYSFYSATPSTYDLRNVNGKRLIPQVDNQGSLGLCWAFALNNSIESYFLKNNLGEIDLSDDQPSYVATYLGDTTFGGGNSSYRAMKYWFMGYGPITEDNFGPYSLYQRDKTLKEYLDNGNIEYDITDVYAFSMLKLDELYANNTLEVAVNKINNHFSKVKSHIMTYGAVFAGVEWYYYNPKTNMVFNDGTEEVDEVTALPHAITIIGWDDNYEGASINGTPVKGAWIAMNSWGDNIEGSTQNNVPYFYISYYDYNVMENIVGVREVKQKTWNNSYTNVELISDTSYSKIYKIEKSNNEETIESIKILFSQLDTTMDIYISDGHNTYLKTQKLHYGINTINFEDVTFSSNKIYITLETEVDSSRIKVSLFTKDTLTEKQLEINKLEFNNMFDQSYYYDIFSKNIDTGSQINVNVFDQNGNNINSIFKINIKPIINDYSQLYLKINGDISNIEYAKIKLESDDKQTELIHYKNGQGYKDDPYIIRTPAELQLLEASNSYFELGNNIDLKEEQTSIYGWYYNGGDGWTPLDYSGHLDGKGYKISNLKSNIGGLFETMSDSSIKNIKLENFTIKDTLNTKSSIGSITKEMDNSSIISNVYVDNLSLTTNISTTGGLVGKIIDGTIKDIHIKDSEINSTKESGLISSIITNPTNKITIQNVYTQNTKINSSTKGAITGILSIYTESTKLKPINLKYNVFGANELNMIGKEQITITDNEEYDIYKEIVIMDSNYIKNETEIYNQETFKNYDLQNIWSFDTTNSAYLKLFKNEFTITNENIIKFQSYKLNDNMIYKVVPKTSKSKFIKDIINIEELNYKIYSQNNNELNDTDYVSTGSYIDVITSNGNQRYYIIVTGDIDGNSVSDTIDAYMIVLHAVSKKELVGKYLLAADYNGDGDTNTIDAYAIVLDSIK